MVPICCNVCARVMVNFFPFCYVVYTVMIKWNWGKACRREKNVQNEIEKARMESEILLLYHYWVILTWSHNIVQTFCSYLRTVYLASRICYCWEDLWRGTGQKMCTKYTHHILHKHSVVHYTYCSNIIVALYTGLYIF